MKVIFSEGIKIEIDDDMLLSWEQSTAGRCVMLAMREGNGVTNYKIDLRSGTIASDKQDITEVKKKPQRSR